MVNMGAFFPNPPITVIVQPMKKAAPTRRRPGRPRASKADGVTKEKIVAAALAQLDAHGLAAFSVRDVARSLNVYHATIFWHFGTRNQLLAQMVAFVLKDLQPPGRGRGWQDWLRELFRRYRSAIQAHPNIAPVIGAQLVSNAHIDFMLIETLLEVLTEAGFKDERLIEAFSVVTAAQVGFVTLEFAPPPADDTAEWSASMRELIGSVAPGRYPILARHVGRMANRSFTLRWQNGSEVPLDRSFAAYVETVIAGLEALARRT
jgi:TetR/AcrR family tetracycline transcriptional repressor